MDPQITLENLILHLKSKKWWILFSSIGITLTVVIYLYFFKLNVFETQLKFYVTNSETVEYNTILDKSFIDISEEKKGLLRLQSFGYSTKLLNTIIDSIVKNEQFEIKEINPNTHRDIASMELLRMYEVSITELGEVMVRVKHENRAFSDFLCHQIMECINAMNNQFLADFKQEQIEATKRHIQTLEESKKNLLIEVNTISKKIREKDIMNEYIKFEKLLKSGLLSFGDLQESVLYQNSPETIELGMSMQKINGIDENLERHNRILNNDQLSLERLSRKKPFVTQDNFPRTNQSLNSLIKIALFSFLVASFMITLGCILYFRYQKYIKMFFN